MELLEKKSKGIHERTLDHICENTFQVIPLRTLARITDVGSGRFLEGSIEGSSGKVQWTQITCGGIHKGICEILE